jgi:hypothetical protein
MELRSPLEVFFQSAFAGGSDQSEFMAPLCSRADDHGFKAIFEAHQHSPWRCTD